MSDLRKFNALIRSANTQQYLLDVLGEKKPSFVANLTALVSNDRKLQECEPLTIMYAALTATSLDLPLDKNLGFAYVVPYKNKKTRMTEAQFQMGYKGYQQLATRSGQYLKINATEVREGELKSFDRLTGDIEFDWCDTDDRIDRRIIGYASFFRLINGFSKTIYMSVEEIEEHAKKYSQTYSSENDYIRGQSKWTTNFYAMAIKTVIKRLLNDGTAPKSIEIITAIEADQSVQRDAGAYSYVDNDTEAAKTRLAEVAQEAAAEAVPEEEAQTPAQVETNAEETTWLT